VIPGSELVVGSNDIEIDFVAGESSLNRNAEFLYTLFVPDRARTAFPLFDQPDLKATYELTLSVPAQWQAMSNAPLVSVREHDARSDYRFGSSDLISSYLFSFVAGKFESVTQERSGRSMTMLHRETDREKVARNVDAIFDLHAAAIEWLEIYTGIEYPYQKFDFALIPAFQYGGMEHVGAIQYRADSLFLDESPSDTQRLGRASLIAHETAHMWFGNLVTMQWFNDVWTKEVFANFMAAKIVNPGFPDIDHDLNFLVRHYPRAYSVDRTTGANPIRQNLPNLNGAGQMYGAIIYNKAPIMMRQLETLIGEDMFREGMQEYLDGFSFANATWPDLIEILDSKSEQDLRAWSAVWVNTSGRPGFETERTASGSAGHRVFVNQRDPSGQKRVWPQQFGIASHTSGAAARFTVVVNEAGTEIDESLFTPGAKVIFNADGLGYGLFPAAIDSLEIWDQLSNVEKGAELINLYENLLSGNGPDVHEYFLRLQQIVVHEKNQLVLTLALDQLETIYWVLLPDPVRREYAAGLETILWQTMLVQTTSSIKKIFFIAFADMALSPDEVQKVYDIWSGAHEVELLQLSENDFIDLAQILSIKRPEQANAIINTQLAKIENPDSKRRLEFVSPSLSADREERDRFFTSLVNEEMRQVESWVLDALRNLHHPLRTEMSEQYILPSLELLREIQVSGDIFFPKRWLDTTLGNYRSATAIRTVRTFLDERPEYDEQLRMKILQSADMMFRANAIISAD